MSHVKKSASEHMHFEKQKSVKRLANPSEALFVPDVLMPKQFFDGMRCNFPGYEGERKMLLAILLDAIECWQGIAVREPALDRFFGSARQRLYREAEFWIFGNSENPPHISFRQACEWLGLDPDFIRRGLVEWKTRQGISTSLVYKVIKRGRNIRRSDDFL